MWTKEWPTETGYYWFYGKTSSCQIIFPVIYPVKVVRTGNNVFLYIIDGRFVYKSEGAEGYWQKAVFPELPKE